MSNPARQAGETAAEQQLAALMDRYQRGESVAAEELVRRLSPALLRYFSLPPDSAADAEDLLQECWMRIHRSRHTFRAAEPVLPWIFAIARHTRLDAYRRRRRRGSMEILTAQVPDVPAPARPPPVDRFAKLVESLPESQREVIVMLKVSGMSLEEVARATSSTVGAVKQKAHRAYEKLRRIWEKTNP